MRSIFILLLILFLPIGRAYPAPDQRVCASQARDYANVIAPLTGASTLKQPPNMPYPNPRDQRPEAMRMVPHQDAYRRAYEACMSRI